MTKTLAPATRASHSVTLQLTHPNQLGMFDRIARTIGKLGGDLRQTDILSPGPKRTTRGLSLRARDRGHAEKIIDAVRNLDRVEVLEISDPVFRLHQGGKISVQSKIPVATRETLSLAYTPGVARVSSAIAEDHSRAWTLTGKGNSIAVVSDGTAVLGLGDIGPEAAMPVMEGKAMLFKEFAGIDAYPVCLRTTASEEIVETVANLSVGFGGINLEDISAPRCFEIEEKLQVRLDIPVFHDDQHGTAIVVLAGLLNAFRLTRQNLSRVRIVISGAGAAGMAITRMLLESGARDIVVCDRGGILHPERAGELNASKQWLARHTNPRRLSGRLDHALNGANVFIGVSAPRLLSPKTIRRMAPRAIVFALANPIPEIMPEEAARHALIVATGRSDYPNQINNVLAFPGVFRGALNIQARRITEDMKLAAAAAIAGCVPQCELASDRIVPSVFDRAVVEKVGSAVAQAAIRNGVARKPIALAKPTNGQITLAAPPRPPRPVRAARHGVL
ncbi:MAG TPA: NAD-dependent malic enzyme [Candidatus Binatia bacterium]|jgi:malate dehydrogenase (oxaloacetate-decarboxylating)|nr:NAD-dependent malic enzyme [Candidatus Binatia bacterium]